MLKRANGRILSMRTNRYSFWTHWRELADFLLPRRYRWLITPNLMNRGSPINGHILDSTGTLAARNCASGIMSGVSSPTRPWFKLKIGRMDSTQTTPASLWLANVERILNLVFHESNFYNSVAIFYLDLVVFGTAAQLIYPHFENVIMCHNPCLGEFYVANDENNYPNVFSREFTYTIQQTVEEFGLENCSADIQLMYKSGRDLDREIIIAHLIEPNTDPHKYGFAAGDAYREVYWQFGGSASPQGSSQATGFLRKRTFPEKPFVVARWDVVSNDPYGRSPGMDALPDVKQLQQETRRKAQGIDKGVNPPMLADIQLKNQPASLLPGGTTYVSGMMTASKPAFAPVYEVKPNTKEISEDIALVQHRINQTFFIPLFQTISQFQTRSNVTAVEIDQRRAEGLVMLGPVLERLQTEALSQWIERAYAIGSRAGIFPPPPPEIQDAPIKIEYISMLQTAQAAAQASSIERVLVMGTQLAGIDPAAMDNLDVDFAIDKTSELLGNDPRLIRSPDQLKAIRANRQRQQQLEQQAALIEQFSKGAKVASEIDVGGGQNALQQMTGIAP